MSFDPQPAELVDRHRDARDRVMLLAASLQAPQAVLPVPGTPLWNVHELFCHIVGGPVTLLAGEVEGAGSAAWTQAQVEARRDTTVAELVTELQGACGSIDAGLLAGELPVPVVFDLLTHEQDLRGAIGAPAAPDPQATRFIIDGFAARAVRVAAKAGLPPLRLLDPDTGWSAGDEGGVVGEASEFDWSRVLTGRRSNAQAAALGWRGDPAPYLDLVSPFGPLPPADIQD